MSDVEIPIERVATWRELPVGAWFYDYAPGCLIPHAVMERTEGGCRAVCHPSWDTPVDEANMRRIAALPDLIAALKALTRDSRFTLAIGGNPYAVEALVKQVDAALAKAEGQV